MIELICISDGCEYELITNDNILFQNILENKKNLLSQNPLYCCPKHKIYHICNNMYCKDCVLVDGICYFSKRTIVRSYFPDSQSSSSSSSRHVMKTKPPTFKTPVAKQLLYKFNKSNFSAQLYTYLKENNLNVETKRFNSIVQQLHSYITNYVYSKCNKQHTNLERCMQKLDFIMQSIFYSLLDQKIPTTFTRNKIFKEINIRISRDLNCPEKDLSHKFDNSFEPEDLYLVRRRQKSNKIWKL